MSGHSSCGAASDASEPGTSAALYTPSPDAGYDADEYTPSRRRPSTAAGKLAAGVDSCVARVLPAGGFASSCFNLCCSTLGASTIALPGAFKACGLVLGPVLLLLFSACTVASVRLLCLATELSGLPTYEDMARKLVGRFLDRLCTLTMMVFCWGSGVSYIVATSEVLRPLLEGHVPPFWSSTAGIRVLTTLFWLVTMLPLALMREINSLRYVSMFGVLAIVFFICVMVAHSAEHGLRNGNLERLALVSSPADTLIGVGLVMFTFCCQPNVPEVYSELREREPRRMVRISAFAMGCCTALYLVAGFFGYVDFGPRVHGSILENYNLGDSPALSVAYACLGIKLTAAHTLCIAPTRDSVLYTLKLGDYHHAEPKRRMLISALLSASALVVALFIPSLQVLFGFLGSLCGSLLGFVFPALFAMRAPGWLDARTRFDTVAAWGLLILGIVVFILGTAASIYQAVA